LGLPASYEDEGVAYKFIGSGLRKRYPDLLLRNYASALGPKLADLTIDTLKKHKIAAIHEDDAIPDQKWSLRSALVGSIVYQDGRYAANEGEWYRIDEAFKQSIEQSFQRLIVPWVQEPTPLRKVYDAQGNGIYQTEASYNAEMSGRLGYALLDQKFIEVAGVDRSDFEPQTCSILRTNGSSM
jgi:uncharacterized protein (TIGR04141 family)